MKIEPMSAVFGLERMVFPDGARCATKDVGFEAHDDFHLVSRFLEQDDEQAFSLLVGRHREPVFRIVVGVLGPGFVADAEDVTQEVFLRLLSGLASFRGESRLSTWLYRLAFRMAVDTKRRVRYHRPHLGDEMLRELPSEGAATNPFDATRSRERAERMAAELDRLPDAERAALYQHYWLGLSLLEIAELLACPEGTVKSYLHRGRKRLAKALGERRDV